MTLDGLTLFKPPYFRLTAIDMSKGDRLWMKPLGNGPLNHPLLKDLNLPPLGGPYHRGAVLVTKTLLFVSVSALASTGVPERPAWSQWGDPDDDRRLIYVFDKQSGQLLHTIELDSLSTAAPMTYLSGGRQYIAVAAGGGRTSEIVAMSLPN
jgi:quinoprotein glucose dehydrogenase